MGGTDDKDNLVALTAREHYVAHQLLYKLNPHSIGLRFSLVAMIPSPHGRRTNRLYAWMRKPIAAALSKVHKGRIKSDRERANISAARRGVPPRTFSEQARKNMAEARKKTWAERRANGTNHLIAQKMAATRKANGGYVFSDEFRRKISAAGMGRIPWNKGLKTGTRGPSPSGSISH